MPLCPSSLFSFAFRQSFLLLTVPLNAESLGSVCPVGWQSCIPVPQDCPGDQYLAVLGGSTLPHLLTARSPLQSAAHSQRGNSGCVVLQRLSGAGADVFSKVPLALGASGALRTLELSGRDMCSSRF